METHIKQIWNFLTEFINVLANTEFLTPQKKCDLLKKCEEYLSFKILPNEDGAHIYSILNSLPTISESGIVSVDAHANVENDDVVAVAVESSPPIFFTPNNEPASEDISSVKKLNCFQDVQVNLDKNLDSNKELTLHEASPPKQEDTSFTNVQMSFSITPFLELNSNNNATNLEENNNPSQADHIPSNEIKCDDSLKPLTDGNSCIEMVKTTLKNFSNESDSSRDFTEIGNEHNIISANEYSVPKTIENSVHSLNLMDDLYLSEDSVDNHDDVNTLNSHVPVENRTFIEDPSSPFDQGDTEKNIVNASKDVAVSSEFSTLIEENKLIQVSEDVPSTLEEKELRQNSNGSPALIEDNYQINNYHLSALPEENELRRKLHDSSPLMEEEKELSQTSYDHFMVLLKDNESRQNSDCISLKETSNNSTYDLLKESESNQNSDNCSTFLEENKLKEAFDNGSSVVFGRNELMQNTDVCPASMEESELKEPSEDFLPTLVEINDFEQNKDLSIHSPTSLRKYVNASPEFPLLSKENSTLVKNSLNFEDVVINSKTVASETSSINCNILCNPKSSDISNEVPYTTVKEGDKLKSKNEARNGTGDIDKFQNEFCKVTAQKFNDRGIKLGFNLTKSCTVTLNPTDYNISGIFKESEEASRTPNLTDAEFHRTLLSDNSATDETQSGILGFDIQFPNTERQKLSENKVSPIPVEGSFLNSRNIFSTSPNLLDRELIHKQSAVGQIASLSNVYSNILDLQKNRSSMEFLSENSIDSFVSPSYSDSSIEKDKLYAKRRLNVKSCNKVSRKKSRNKQTVKKTFPKKGKLPHKMPKSNSKSTASLSFEEYLTNHLEDLKKKSNLSKVIQNTAGKSGNANAFSSIDQSHEENIDLENDEFNSGERSFEDPTAVDDPYALFGKEMLNDNDISNSFEIAKTEFSTYVVIEPNQNVSTDMSSRNMDEYNKDFETANHHNCSQNTEESSLLKCAYTQIPNQSTNPISPTPHIFDKLTLNLSKKSSKNFNVGDISSKNLMHSSAIEQIKTDFGIFDEDNCSQMSEGLFILKDVDTELPSKSTNVLSTPQISEYVKDNQNTSKIVSVPVTIVGQNENDFSENNSSQISKDLHIDGSISVPVKDNQQALKRMFVSITDDPDQIENDFDVVDVDNCSQSNVDSYPSKDINVEHQDELTELASPILQISKKLESKSCKKYSELIKTIENNDNSSLERTLLSYEDVHIDKNVSSSLCSELVPKVSDAPQDLEVPPGSFEDYLMKCMKEDEIVRKHQNSSNLIELSKNSKASSNEFFNAPLEEGNQYSLKVSELEKDNSVYIRDNPSLNLDINKTDFQNNTFRDENNSISSNDEGPIHIQDSRMGSSEQLHNTVTQPFDFGVLPSDNIISQFSTQATELEECNENVAKSQIVESAIVATNEKFKNVEDESQNGHSNSLNQIQMNASNHNIVKKVHSDLELEDSFKLMQSENTLVNQKISIENNSVTPDLMLNIADDASETIMYSPRLSSTYSPSIAKKFQDDSSNEVNPLESIEIPLEKVACKFTDQHVRSHNTPLGNEKEDSASDCLKNIVNDKESFQVIQKQINKNTISKINILEDNATERDHEPLKLSVLVGKCFKSDSSDILDFQQRPCLQKKEPTTHLSKRCSRRSSRVKSTPEENVTLEPKVTSHLQGHLFSNSQIGQIQSCDTKDCQMKNVPEAVSVAITSRPSPVWVRGGRVFLTKESATEQFDKVNGKSVEILRNIDEKNVGNYENIDKWNDKNADNCENIGSRPSPVWVRGGRVFLTKESATEQVDKVNGKSVETFKNIDGKNVGNYENIDNRNDENVDNCENIGSKIKKGSVITEGTTVPFVEKMSLHETKQKKITIRNYYLKTVCVVDTLKVPSVNKKVLIDECNINDNNQGNFLEESHSSDKTIDFDNSSEFEPFDAEFNEHVCNVSDSASSTKAKSLLKPKECCVLLNTNGHLPNVSTSDIPKKKKNDLAVSYLEKSNKEKGKLFSKNCDVPVKSIKIPSQDVNLVEKNKESCEGIINETPVLEIERNILATADKASCNEEQGIATNKTLHVWYDRNHSDSEQEVSNNEDCSREQFNINSQENKHNNKEVSDQQDLLLDPMKTPPKCVNLEIDIQQCYIALEPVVIPTNDLNMTVKVHKSLTGLNKSSSANHHNCSQNTEESSITEPEQCLFNTEKSPHNKALRSSQKKCIFSTLDVSSASDSRQALDFSSDASTKCLRKRKMEDVSEFELNAKKNFKLKECFVLIKPAVLSQSEHINQKSSFNIENKILPKDNSKSSNSIKNICAVDNAEVVNCKESTMIKNRNSKTTFGGHINVQSVEDNFQTGVSVNSNDKDNSTFQNSNNKQNKSALRRSKRKNSADFESSTSKLVCSEIKAKNLAEYFQFFDMAHLQDVDFETSVSSLIVILNNRVNYPSIPALLFEVINYLSLSEKNPLLKFVESENQIVLLPKDEDCIITAFFKLDSNENSHLKGLLEAAVDRIQNLLLSKEVKDIYGLASLCRVATEIARRKKDKLAALTLCCNLLKSKHQFAPYLIASIGTIWRGLFQMEDCMSVEESILHSSIMYAVKKRSNMEELDWNISMKIISDFQTSHPVVDVQKSVIVIITILETSCCIESWTHCYMLKSALVIFAVYEDWNWIQEVLLDQHVIPNLLKFGFNTIQNKAFDLFSDLYVDLFLMNPIANPREEVLIKFFKKENMNLSLIRGYSSIQETAAIALMKFIVLKSIPLPRLLTRWFQSNCDNPKVVAIKTLFIGNSKYH